MMQLITERTDVPKRNADVLKDILSKVLQGSEVRAHTVSAELPSEL